MKTQKPRYSIALSLLFSGMVFVVLILTLFLVGVVSLFLLHHGFLPMNDSIGWLERFIITTTVISIAIGSVMTLLLSRISLKPINTLIQALNRLASGDYKTRLSFPGHHGTQTVADVLTSSFNSMAAELEKTEMLRADFVNNFSHEFKTPIVSIAGFAKLLKYDNLTEEQRAEYINIIEEESLRLSYMATNVLNLTKVENQTILTNLSRFNLSEQLRNCVLLLENKWTKKNLNLEINFGEYDITANEELLKQVWINLLDNAIKFTPEDGTVQLDITKSDESLSVLIANTGTDIPTESLAHIFNKFYQADESHATEGNGVGLAIVKRITELHEGSVSVESKNGRTVFTVNLPNS